MIAQTIIPNIGMIKKYLPTTDRVTAHEYPHSQIGFTTPVDLYWTGRNSQTGQVRGKNMGMTQPHNPTEKIHHSQGLVPKFKQAFSHVELS